MKSLNKEERQVIIDNLPSCILSVGLITQAIDNLVVQVHTNWAVPKGWWNDLHTGEQLGCHYVKEDGTLSGENPKGSKSYGDQNSLFHAELSEAYEGYRKNQMSDKIPDFTAVEEELADTLIRILDTAGGMNLRLAEAFAAKMVYNHYRPDHNPENRLKADGKKT